MIYLHIFDCIRAFIEQIPYQPNYFDVNEYISLQMVGGTRTHFPEMIKHFYSKHL